MKAELKLLAVVPPQKTIHRPEDQRQSHDP